MANACTDFDSCLLSILRLQLWSAPGDSKTCCLAVLQLPTTPGQGRLGGKMKQHWLCSVVRISGMCGMSCLWHESAQGVEWNNMLGTSPSMLHTNTIITFIVRACSFSVLFIAIFRHIVNALTISAFHGLCCVQTLNPKPQTPNPKP